MRLFTLHADGQITPGVPADETERRAVTLVEIDDEPGTDYRGPFRRDPANPRRAIPHAGMIAARAVAARRAKAIDAETRMVVLARLRTRLANAGKRTAWVDAQIAAADAEVADALRDET